VSRLVLADDEVHLWRLALDTGDEQHAALRDEAERARGARFLREMHRRRFLAAHVGLRRALARYAECTPAELEFRTSETDKPSLVDADGLEFNLSHSGEHALVAVTRAGIVGVDVEVARVLQDLEALARRFFAPEESAALMSLPEVERPAAFRRLWTRKEAFLKAWGTGLAGGLSSFAVSMQAGSATLLRNDDPARTRLDWTLWDLDAGPSAAGACALACEGGPKQLRLVEQGRP